MKYILRSLMVVLVALIACCRTVPHTGRTQLMLTSSQEENALGLKAFNQYKTKFNRSSNATYNQALASCGKALVAVSGNSEFAWEFTVFDSKTQNAFCLPGGKVAVYSGLMDLMNNEAELAFVVAHEVAHALARHSGERMSWSYLQTLGGSLVASAFQNSMYNEMYKQGTELGVMLPFSRSDEYEADRMGMLLMAKAGYNPKAAVEFWSRFVGTPNDSFLDGLMSTHPRDVDRIEAMKKNMAEAEAAYAAAPVKRGYGMSI